MEITFEYWNKLAIQNFLITKMIAIWGINWWEVD